MNSFVVEQIQNNFIAYFCHFAGLHRITFVDEEAVTWVASQGLPGSMVRVHSFQ